MERLQGDLEPTRRAKPVILAVDDERSDLACVAEELSNRYGRDYEVLCHTSAHEASEALHQIVEDGGRLALVLAGLWMTEMNGDDFLAASRSLDAGIKRGLLIPWGAWGDEATAEAIVRAMTLGHIDYYVLKPWQSPDELFHRTITSFLQEWWRSQPPSRPRIAVVGNPPARRSYEIRDFLNRQRVEHAFHSPESPEGRALLKNTGDVPPTLPVLVTTDGRLLHDPSNAQIAAACGLKTELGEDREFDVVIVGAGPAGLAAAVYGSSEGLATLVVEGGAVGGQAGSSSLIRNYLGFARGISGSELAAQAYQQAWVFGTRFLMMQEATSIRRTRDKLVIGFSGGDEVETHAVILAAGVSYRRLGIDALEKLAGAGVFYGSASSEAQALEGSRVYIVGGGNSAGQAAVYLARYAASVTIVVREESLDESMSDYLIQEIETNDKVRVRTRTKVVDGGGEGRLEFLVLNNGSGEEERVGADALFIMIGAQPFTSWLPDEIKRDRSGYVLTGRELSDNSGPAEPPLLFESSMPGVFAVGDIRHGSIKRVASAVGEGSIVIRLVFEKLEAERQARPSAIT
jgi:thioredoxin reductase (NADPH)